VIVAGSTAAAADLDFEARHSTGGLLAAPSSAQLPQSSAPRASSFFADYVDRLTEVGPRRDSTAEMQFQETAPPSIPSKSATSVFKSAISILIADMLMLGPAC
jgi:hypothetical protein